MSLRSLRARLLAGVIAIAAICVIALAAIVYAQQRDFLLQRVDEQAKSAAPLAARVLDEEGIPRPQGDGLEGHGHGGRGFAPGDRDGDRGRGPGPSLSTSAIHVERRDLDGSPLGGVTLGPYGEGTPSPPQLPADLTPAKPFTVRARDGSLDYRVRAEPSPGGGLTVVAIALSGVDEQLEELLLVEATVIGVALLLMAALGWWVVQLGLRPLERIGDTAGKIAGGDLSRRVEPAEPSTEIGRLGLALNAMLAQIERAFSERAMSEDRLRRFLADASHELRTPLASIRGYAELFRMGAVSDEGEARRAMSRIEQEAARMGVLVEDLLLLARLDEVRDTGREPVDLAEVAADAAADARATAPDREIALHLADAGTVVAGDEDRLRQVVGNLVRNALVHTPDGTPVELAVEAVGGRVRLTVADRGPGLPVLDGRVTFERFWRAEPGRGRGAAGAGLGLAIVDGIIAAHGGEVRAETRPDGGAIFAVELPAL